MSKACEKHEGGPHTEAPLKCELFSTKPKWRFQLMLFFRLKLINRDARIISLSTNIALKMSMDSKIIVKSLLCSCNSSFPSNGLICHSDLLVPRYPVYKSKIVLLRGKDSVSPPPPCYSPWCQCIWGWIYYVGLTSYWTSSVMITNNTTVFTDLGFEGSCFSSVFMTTWTL